MMENNIVKLEINTLKEEEYTDNRSFSETIADHLRQYFDAHGYDLPSTGLYDRIIGEVERCLITETLSAVGGNQLRAAELLGINRNTLRTKIKTLSIAIPEKRKK